MPRQYTIRMRSRERTVRVQFEVSRLAATHLRDAYAQVDPQSRRSWRDQDPVLRCTEEMQAVPQRSGGHA
jgi:hypothetical protein